LKAKALIFSIRVEKKRKCRCRKGVSLVPLQNGREENGNIEESKEEGNYCKVLPTLF